MDPLQFSWVVSSLHIKEEGGETVQTLLSPPTTPSSFNLSSSPGLPPRTLCPSPPLLTSRRARPRPYPPSKPVLKKDPESPPQSLPGMQWHNSNGMRRPISAADRRLSDAERQPTYDNSSLVNGAFMMHTTPGSSLMGTINEASDSQFQRALYPNNTIAWNPEMPMMSGNTDTYPGVPGHSALYPPLPTPGYENLETRHSPESIAPNSPSYYPTVSDNGYMAVGPYRASSSSSGSQSPYSREDPEAEVRRLRKKVKELQQALVEARTTTSSGTSLPMTSAFRSGWKRRTEARKRLYCSLNRAGNALCAWHDSRRERRQYPPRNAPPGMLNCGCTHEEALFEESLSRHSVGGYLPGESVRMDPELRRPLLRLLQKRYGYKDGDFDYDPQTMEWYPEQDPDAWDRQAHTGSSARTRRPDHADRH